MRFILRGLLGLVQMLLVFALIGYGGFQVYSALTAEDSTPARRAPERSFIVTTQRLTAETITPEISSFGELVAWRSVEIRTAQPGRITQLNENFRDGVRVKQGAVLARVDPADARTRADDARAALADARAQLENANRVLRLSQIELQTSERQFRLQQAELERQMTLWERGIVARVAVERAENTVQSARSTYTNRQQSLNNAQTQLAQSKLRVDRAVLALNNALRDQEETTITAPFTGYLSNPVALTERLVSTNERLATLIDPESLEVKFNISNREYARLLDEQGNLLKQAVRVTVDLGVRTVTINGRLERAAALTDENGARTLFATLNQNQRLVLRPGEFVQVIVTEPVLRNVARIPIKAATEDGGILILTDDGRLEEVTVEILRRTETSLIVSNAPFGQRYVTERLPQLGPGIKARSSDDPAPEPVRGARGSAGPPNAGGEQPPRNERSRSSEGAGDGGPDARSRGNPGGDGGASSGERKQP